MVSTGQKQLTAGGVREELHCRAIPWEDDLGSDIYLCWEQLLARLPAGTVFHHPEWTAQQCLCGTVRPWRILVVSRRDEPLAIIPLRKRTPVTAEIIDDFCHDYPPLLIDPEAEAEVWASITAWLREQRGMCAINFGRQTQPERWELFRAMTRQHGGVPRTEYAVPNMMIALPQSWETYLASLGSRTRAELRRLERQFQEMPDATLEIITEPRTGEAALAALIALHRRRWHRQLIGSIFDHPRHAAFYRHILCWALQRQAAGIATLRIGQQVLAVGTFFHTPGQGMLQCHYLACERGADLPKRFSPGILLFSHIARWAIARGVRMMDMGFGTEEYKKLLGGVPRERQEMILARSPSDAVVARLANVTAFYLRRLPIGLRYLYRQIVDTPAKEPPAVPSVTMRTMPSVLNTCKSGNLRGGSPPER